MAAASADQFDAYFRAADLNHDGKITGDEAVAFFKGSNLPQQVLAQVPIRCNFVFTEFTSLSV